MEETQRQLQNRYPFLHPLIFQRSRERAKTNGELFDFLEGVPSSYPIRWNEDKREWETIRNIVENPMEETDNASP